MIAALMTHRTIQEAASAVGLHERRFREIMKDSDFKNLYDQARRDLLTDTTKQIQQLMSEAIETTAEVMRNKKTGKQTRLLAAQSILKNGLRFIEAEQKTRLAAGEEEKPSPMLDAMFRAIQEHAQRQKEGIEE